MNPSSVANFPSITAAAHGEMHSAFAIHFHIEGLERSTFSTHEICVAEGGIFYPVVISILVITFRFFPDDSYELLAALDSEYGLFSQLDKLMDEPIVIEGPNGKKVAAVFDGYTVGGNTQIHLGHLLS